MKEIRDRYDIFLKVCETGNFSRAAEALNYTQSGISQMMAGLEEELGVQLFARIKKGVILTDNGKRLLPYIQEMVNQKDKLRQAAFNINNKVEGKLRIGSFTSVTAMWMPDVIRFFQEKYGLTLTEENASAMITHLCAALGRIHRLSAVEPLDEEVYEETSQEPTFPKALEATQALVREILPDLPEDEQKFLTMHIGVVLAQS